MYERGIRGWLKHLDFILLDMLSLALAFFAALACGSAMLGAVISRSCTESC